MKLEGGALLQARWDPGGGDTGPARSERRVRDAGATAPWPCCALPCAPALRVVRGRGRDHRVRVAPFARARARRLRAPRRHALHRLHRSSRPAPPAGVRGLPPVPRPRGAQRLWRPSGTITTSVETTWMVVSPARRTAARRSWRRARGSRGRVPYGSDGEGIHSSFPPRAFRGCLPARHPVVRADRAERTRPGAVLAPRAARGSGSARDSAPRRRPSRSSPAGWSGTAPSAPGRPTTGGTTPRSSRASVASSARRGSERSPRRRRHPPPTRDRARHGRDRGLPAAGADRSPMHERVIGSAKQPHPGLLFDSGIDGPGAERHGEPRARHLPSAGGGALRGDADGGGPRAPLIHRARPRPEPLRGRDLARRRSRG